MFDIYNISTTFLKIDLPRVAVIKTDAVHNAEVGKVVLEERGKIKVHIFFEIF